MIRVLLFLTLLVSYKTYAQLATEPASQPTGLEKSGQDLPYTFDINFTGSGADGYLLLRSTEPINFVPVDGTVYEKGQGVGNAKVFSFSNTTFLRVREVAAGTTYYFAVYAYNQLVGDPGSVNYLTTDPLRATISSKGPDYSYYSNIDFASSTILQDLRTLTSAHTIMDYDDFGVNMIPNVFERDTVGGQHVVECQYSGRTYVYTGSFNFSTGNFNREHRMPVSWMNFTNMPRSDFELTAEGADYHALELVDADVNSDRLNYPYSSNIVSISGATLDFRFGRDSRNKFVAEIRDDRKGDAARALFYMMLTYNGTRSQNWGLDNLESDAQDQLVQDLLDWHTQDPPDGFERARNEFIYSIQGNKNPFIDYPRLADCIDFADVTTKTDCGFVGVSKAEFKPKAVVFPQPATTAVNIQLDVPYAHAVTLSLVDINGRTIDQQHIDLNTGNQLIKLHVDGLPGGLYLYHLQADNYQASGRVLIGDH